jgi:hypothetical protein
MKILFLGLLIYIITIGYYIKQYCNIKIAIRTEFPIKNKKYKQSPNLENIDEYMRTKVFLGGKK